MRRTFAAAVAALAVLAAAATTASAHQGNPNMESIVRGVQPAIPGLSIQVLNRDDRFALVYHGSEQIVIDGYNGEPYARLSPDGTVEVNRNSPAYYLNQDRTGTETVPPNASAKATPSWTVVDRSGRFEWHDHRMHFMGTGTPAAVKDTSKRQKVFDYSIPIHEGGKDGKIVGTLWWTPREDGGVPIAPIIAFVVVGLGGAALVTVLRRRRRGGPGGDARGGGTPAEPVEAW